MFAQPSPTQPSHTRLNGMVSSLSPAVPHEPSAAPHEPGEVQRHAPTAVPRNSTGSLHADTQVSRLRDLLLADVPAGRLVIACDAVGGIGSRPGDSYPADPTWCAHLAARVPLLEVLCGGAQPMVLVNTLCQDAASAQPMIEEFQRCAVATGIDPQAVTGSTEDNVITTQTGIGVTVIGVRPDRAPGTPVPGEASAAAAQAQEADVLVCVGSPISAPDDEVRPGRREIVTLDEVRALLGSGLVHDCVPVGSHGIAWEADQIAVTAGLRFDPGRTDLDLTKSGGPSTCVVLACAPEDVSELRTHVSDDRPWARIGTLQPQHRD